MKLGPCKTFYEGECVTKVFLFLSIFCIAGIFHGETILQPQERAELTILYFVSVSEVVFSLFLFAACLFHNFSILSVCITWLH